jgi:hypothetical protein
MATGDALPITQYRRFESFREYESLMDAMVPQTEMFIRVFDKVLPPAWNGLQRTELLRQFLRRNPANRLYVILHDTGNIEGTLPRLKDLLRDFGHAFKIRQTPSMARHLYDPFIIFDASHYLHRFHHAHMRAAIGTHDVEGARQLLDRHAELWEASAPASVNASGL